MCPRALSDRHDQTKTDRALCFFFYWTTTGKLEFTDWSEVQRRLGSKEIAIFRQRMIIASPPPGQLGLKMKIVLNSLLSAICFHILELIAMKILINKVEIFKLYCKIYCMTCNAVVKTFLQL